MMKFLYKLLFRFLSTNYIHLGGANYIVKNQNGLNNALYHYFANFSYTKKEVRAMVETVPKQYPAKIYVDDCSFECQRIFIETL